MFSQTNICFLKQTKVFTIEQTYDLTIQPISTQAIKEAKKKLKHKSRLRNVLLVSRPLFPDQDGCIEFCSRGQLNSIVRLIQRKGRARQTCGITERKSLWKQRKIRSLWLWGHQKSPCQAAPPLWRRLHDAQLFSLHRDNWPGQRQRHFPDLLDRQELKRVTPVHQISKLCEPLGRRWVTHAVLVKHVDVLTERHG